MPYFVIGPDGSKYGPADIPVLKNWVLEGRILATTELEDSDTGQRMPASQVPDLGISNRAASVTPPPATPPVYGQPTYQQPTYQQPMYGQQAGYQRPHPVSVDNHLAKAIFSALCCCLPLGVVAIVFAALSSSKAGVGDSWGASDCADKADTWSNWAIGLGLVSGIIQLILRFAVMGQSGRGY